MSDDLFAQIEEKKDREEIIATARRLWEKGKKDVVREGLALAALYAQEEQKLDSEKAFLEALYRLEPAEKNKKALLQFYSRILDVSPEALNARIGGHATGGVIGILHNFFPFAKGRFVRHKLYGTGKVLRIQIETEELTVQFTSGERKLDLNRERKYLSSLPDDSFLVEKFLHPDRVKEQARKEPLKIIERLLNEFGDLKESEIKAHLQDVLGTATSTFWKKARKEMLKSPTIHLEKLGDEIMVTLASGVDKKEALKALFEQVPIPEKVRLLKEMDRGSPQFRAFLEKVQKNLENLPLAEQIALLYQLKEAGLIRREPWEEKLSRASADQLIRALPQISEKARREALKSLLLGKGTAAFFTHFSEFYSDILSFFKELPEETQRETLHFYTTICLKFPEAFFTCLRILKQRGEELSKEHLRAAIEAVKADPAYAHELGLFSWDASFLSQLSREDADSLHQVLSQNFDKHDAEAVKRKIVLHRLFPHLIPKEEWIIYTSRSSIQSRQKGLDRLQNVEIPKNTEEIARARSYGDLSENHEYKAAKEKQALLYSQLKKLQSELKAAVDLEEVKRPDSIVTVGKRVIFKNNEMEKSIAFSGLWDVNEQENVFSYKTPFAQKAFGKTIGEIVEIENKIWQISAIHDL